MKNNPKVNLDQAFRLLGYVPYTPQERETEKRNMDAIAELTAQLRKQRGMA